MIATLVNAAVVIACALLGNFLQRGFPDRLRTLLMQALGICIVVVGLRMVLDVSNDIVIVLSIAIGTVIGHFCQLDRHLDNLGVRVKGAFGERTAIVIGYANDYQGYFVPEYDFGGTSYESYVTKMPRGGIEKVLDEYEESL